MSDNSKVEMLLKEIVIHVDRAKRIADKGDTFCDKDYENTHSTLDMKLRHEQHLDLLPDVSKTSMGEELRKIIGELGVDFE